MARPEEEVGLVSGSLKVCGSSTRSIIFGV